MKKYVFGFLAVIVAAVLTGALYADYTVKKNNASASRAGYNLVLENQTGKDFPVVTVRYEHEGKTLEAASMKILMSGEKQYYRMEPQETMAYQVILSLPEGEPVEAALEDDFGKDQIVRYQIREQNGEIVLVK